MLGVFFGICITLMFEYEVKVFSFDGVYETFNFLMVTFSTVGYGKFYVPQTFMGRFSICIAVPIGLGIQALMINFLQNQIKMN